LLAPLGLASSFEAQNTGDDDIGTMYSLALHELNYAQFSSFNPGTVSNSFMLLVTSVTDRLLA